VHRQAVQRENINELTWSSQTAKKELFRPRVKYAAESRRRRPTVSDWYQNWKWRWWSVTCRPTAKTATDGSFMNAQLMVLHRRPVTDTNCVKYKYSAYSGITKIRFKSRLYARWSIVSNAADRSITATIVFLIFDQRWNRRHLINVLKPFRPNSHDNRWTGTGCNSKMIRRVCVW